MALDVITYDKVDESEKNLGNKIDGLSGTIEGLPEEVQNQLDAFKATIDELKKNVEDTLADVQETVEKSPAGVLPPSLMEFSSQSTEDGINITYTPNAIITANASYEQYDNQMAPLALTKSIMFRYSDVSFPLTVNDGNLAFIDDDIYKTDDNGIRHTDRKTKKITGLTTNKTYYISAFPCSYGNVYNESSGEGNHNRTKCQWTGTKGTLTVNVTQDYDYNPLGEYTATLTPTAGGDPVAKTQSGEATIVFSGLEAGEYTLSFSAPQYFTAPQSQSVTVISGQSQTVDKMFEFYAILNELTIEEIVQIAQDENFEQLFTVGDILAVNIPVLGGNIEFELVGTNHDYLSASKTANKAKLSFLSKDLPFKYRVKDETGIASYKNGALDKYLNSTVFNSMPDNLKTNIKTIYKWQAEQRSYSESAKGSWNSYKLFVPVACEMTNNYSFSSYGVYGASPAESANGMKKYARFTSDSQIIKKHDGSNSDYWTSSRNTYYDTNDFYVFIDDGTYGHTVGETDCTKELGVCFGFCLG